MVSPPDTEACPGFCRHYGTLPPPDWPDKSRSGQQSRSGRALLVAPRHFVARLKTLYDLLFSQHLILQPEADLDFCSKSDVTRGSGSGFSDIDT